MFSTLKNIYILETVHWKALYGPQNGFLWYRWKPLLEPFFKSALNCRSALMCSTCIYSGGVVNAEDIVWTSCLLIMSLIQLKCALVRQKWAAGWGSSVRWKTTVRERFTPPSRDRRWRPRSGWPTRTTTWTSWWGKTVRCQSFSYLWWIHSDIKWLLKETISRVRNVEVRIICEELLKGEIKPWHTEILQQRSLILCCSANPRSDDTCKWQTQILPELSLWITAAW